MSPGVENSKNFATPPQITTNAVLTSQKILQPTKEITKWTHPQDKTIQLDNQTSNLSAPKLPNAQSANKPNNYSS
jgi:hypothetical protein